MWAWQVSLISLTVFVNSGAQRQLKNFEDFACTKNSTEKCFAERVTL